MSTESGIKPTKEELLRLANENEALATEHEEKAVSVADGYYKVYCGNCGPPGFWPARVDRETALFIFFASDSGNVFRVPKQQLSSHGQYFHPTSSTRYYTAEHVREWHQKRAVEYRQKARVHFEDACLMDL